MSDKFDEEQPIIVKRKKGHGHGHHGGAWKVAYADFVTAMMAFFLLLWLLAATSESTKEGIADYFTTSPLIVVSESGSGGILGGRTVQMEGAMTSNKQPLVDRPKTQEPAFRPGSDPVREETNVSEERFLAEQRQREQDAFEKTAEQIRQAIETNPRLSEFKDNLRIEQTTEGLKIELLEQQNKPLFASGSAAPLTGTRQLLRTVSELLQSLPNEISIRGHTDSVPYGPDSSYTNWDLSADRANAARRVIQQSGFPPARINNVLGKADSDPLIKDNPRDGRNRRISIVALYQSVAAQQGPNASARAAQKYESSTGETAPLYQRSEGEISFP
jgi:chemotaxis protein MotB